MTHVALVKDMSDRDYHAHASLSSTGARQLLAPGCPAQFAHDRQHPRAPTETMRVGRAAHRIVLGSGADIVFGDYPNYRTKESRDWRDTVEARGDIPMLTDSPDASRILGMRTALHRHPVFGAVFDPARGDAETSAFWTDPDTQVDCRARFDYLPHPQPGRRPILADYKTTEDANPTEFARSAAKWGYPMQADWYLRPARHLYDDEPAFVFVVQSKTPPYLVSVVQLGAEDLAYAHARNDMALRIFKECTDTGVWPGWGDNIHTLEMPTWWRIESDNLTERDPHD